MGNGMGQSVQQKKGWPGQNGGQFGKKTEPETIIKTSKSTLSREVFKAIQSGDINRLKSLMKKGERIDLLDEQGRGGVEIAEKHRHREMAAFLRRQLGQ